MTSSGRLLQLKKKGKVQLGNPKVIPTLMGVVTYKYFLLQSLSHVHFKWDGTKVIITKAGHL